MKRIILLSALAVISAAALAATVTVNWTMPTTNTDGSAIPATGPGSIASSRVEWGTCNGTAFGTKSGEVVVNGSATTTTIPNLTPGTWCVRGYVTNTFGVESDPTNAAQKVVPAPKPNPPSNFSLN